MGQRKMSVVGYTSGVFDLFHIGHLNVLKQAKQNCDKLIVAVTTDELCQSHKGHRPFISFQERFEIIQSIGVVDDVVPQSSMDKFAAWQTLKFNRMFVGDDWKGTDTWNKLEAEFAIVGVDIVYFPYTKTTSSTLLRAALVEITSGRARP
jgi:glycerol-3-phosphate cytidylyltransferase